MKQGATKDSRSTIVTGVEMDWKEFLFSFEGRINRKPYWFFSVVVFLLYVMLRFVINGNINLETLARRDGVSSIYMLIFVWPTLAIQTKRWHDRNKSGWWQLINIIPIIGGLWSLFEVGLLEGTQGDNRFGKDPLEGVEKRYAFKRQLTTKEITWAAGTFVLLLLILFGWLLRQVFISANK